MVSAWQQKLGKRSSIWSAGRVITGKWNGCHLNGMAPLVFGLGRGLRGEATGGGGREAGEERKRLKQACVGHWRSPAFNTFCLRSISFRFPCSFIFLLIARKAVREQTQSQMDCKPVCLAGDDSIASKHVDSASVGRLFLNLRCPFAKQQRKDCEWSLMFAALSLHAVLQNSFFTL